MVQVLSVPISFCTFPHCIPIDASVRKQWLTLLIVNRKIPLTGTFSLIFFTFSINRFYFSDRLRVTWICALEAYLFRKRIKVSVFLNFLIFFKQNHGLLSEVLVSTVKHEILHALVRILLCLVVIGTNCFSVSGIFCWFIRILSRRQWPTIDASKWSRETYCVESR